MKPLFDQMTSNFTEMTDDTLQAVGVYVNMNATINMTTNVDYFKVEPAIIDFKFDTISDILSTL